VVSTTAAMAARLNWRFAALSGKRDVVPGNAGRRFRGFGVFRPRCGAVPSIDAPRGAIEPRIRRATKGQERPPGPPQRAISPDRSERFARRSRPLPFQSWSCLGQPTQGIESARPTAGRDATRIKRPNDFAATANRTRTELGATGVGKHFRSGPSMTAEAAIGLVFESSARGRWTRSAYCGCVGRPTGVFQEAGNQTPGTNVMNGILHFVYATALLLQSFRKGADDPVRQIRRGSELPRVVSDYVLVLRVEGS